ncbi:hypothetical protein [Nibribacter koreensis]|uniref:Uncharacterized protein n=1 Tax=Nibribacter koreensis TaxID=1084519 RepID=A0ABP8FBP8_9BACT
MVDLLIALLLQLGILTGGIGQKQNTNTSASNTTTTQTTNTNGQTTNTTEEDKTTDGNDSYGGTGTWDTKD